MAKLAEDVFSTRAARNTARAELEGRIESLRGDLEERGLAGRIADEVKQEASAALDGAMEVANESKGVIAGTIALLVIWLLRNPIIAWLEKVLAGEDEMEKDDSDDDG